jgi:hypothetical protein
MPAPSPTPTPSYDRLGRTPTYVGDDVGLRLPEQVPLVTAVTNADLVVLHGNPGIDADQAVTWLAADRVLALLGDDAQRTWREWTRSESFRDTFDTRASSEADPAPHLLVAGAVDVDVTTSRFSWAELPSNEAIVGSLEEALGDIETWTPPGEARR